MTPEQKQLEQIQEHLAQRKAEARPLPSTEIYVAHVDFLLSLVKSQEADRHKRRNPYSEECRAAIDELERLFESEEVELCSIDYVHQREDHSATSMRSACVEKVKELTEQYRRTLQFGTGATGQRCRDRIRFSNEVIEALESLSIEKPKE